MKINFLIVIFIFSGFVAYTQSRDSMISFKMLSDVLVTIDTPPDFNGSKKTLLILYALPNGNSTAQTMGKKIQPGDDWHYDIQHIRAQTQFIRGQLTNQNIIVAYLENDLKSWPAWKTKHDNYVATVQHIVDTLYHMFPPNHTAICLSGHSGGGRFIFSYLDGIDKIPSYIQRIVFLDSDYGYEKAYGIKLRRWLLENKSARLQTFAYNDSVALYQGKRIVSDTGGTWYRSHLMLKDLSPFFRFRTSANDSMIIYQSYNRQVGFYFKTNPQRQIYHTTQVELNGFIHSILAGTRRESKDYEYYGKRAYSEYIR